MEYDISMILPTIRTHLLEDLYNSIEKSCPNHSFELVMVGPFDIPEYLQNKKNIKHIKDYGSPTRAMQIALINATGKLVQPLVDDCLYYPDMLSNTIEIFNEQNNDKTILGMRFFESPEHYKAIKERGFFLPDENTRNKAHPIHYWYACGGYNLACVNPNWGSACLFIADTNLVKEFGGWDCQFEYNNHSTHDLLFRMQKYGSQFFITNYDVFVANWYQGTTVDHAPVHYGQLTHDEPLFRQVWSQINDRYRVHLDNYKYAPEIWTRRFNKGIPKTYQEMMDATSISQ